MSEYRIQSETLENIADAIRGKTGGSALIAPEDMADEIDGLATVTDGIVAKAKNESGYPTEIDYYGDVVPPWFVGRVTTSATHYLHKVEKINWKTNVTTLKEGFGTSSGLTELTVPESVVNMPSATGGFCANATRLVTLRYLSPTQIDFLYFTGCTNLETVYAPNIPRIYSRQGSATANGAFQNCGNLKTAEFGSIGHPISSVNLSAFIGCTRTDLVITVYTTESYVDTLVSNIRNGATNATIIIKASGETTYNGTTYQAGDTILTSEVESNES